MRIASITAFLLFLFASTVFGQEIVPPEPKKLQQLYLSAGSGKSFTNAKNINHAKGIFSGSITVCFKNTFATRIGHTQGYFQDNLSSLGVNGPDLKMQAPFHNLATTYLSYGKGKVISRNVLLQVLAGPAYSRYHEKTNLTIRDYDSKLTGSRRAIEYETEKHNKPGLVLQADAMFLPTRFAGLTLGGYYHFIPKISNAGLNLGLNLGRLRTKEIL